MNVMQCNINIYEMRCDECALTYIILYTTKTTNWYHLVDSKIQLNIKLVFLSSI